VLYIYICQNNHNFVYLTRVVTKHIYANFTHGNISDRILGSQNALKVFTLLQLIETMTTKHFHPK
jgi:hypothetical protein